jgi:lipoprotein-anchoring transpeptidase ErfK/SrfK
VAQEQLRTKLAGWLIAVALMPSASATAANIKANDSPQSSEVRRLVVVSIPDRELAVVEGGKVIRIFPVAVGARISPSPTGRFVIVSRLANPTYYHAGVVIPAGSDNPLGPRWLGINQKGYGIHGTNAPGSIGHASSHGCIRLRNRDIKQLFEMVRVGDEVEIRGERGRETARIFGRAIDSSTVASASVGSSHGGSQ